MGIHFNADEILAMAEQIERNGARFYRKAAGCAKAARSKQRLLGLAEMEDGHERTFIAIRAQLSEKEKGGDAFDPLGEAEAYLKAFADGSVFDVKGDPSSLLRGGETIQQILKMAISLEKDSVVFYTGLRDVVPASLGKDKVEAIVREELRHIAQLSADLAAAGKQAPS